MLDTLTLMLVLLLTTLVLAVVLTLVSANQRQYPGPRFWAGASWLVFLGVALLLLRDQVNDFISVVVSNGVLFAAFAFIIHGLRRFLALDAYPRLYASLVTMSTLLAFVFLYVWENTAARVMVFTATMVLLIADGCQAVLRHIPSGAAWAYRFTGITLAMTGLYQAFRFAFTFWGGHPDSLFGPNLVTALNSMVLSFSYLALTVGLVMMLAARLATDLNAHMADLRDEIGIRRQAEERLAKEATMDPLTGAANRRKLFEDATRAMAQARRHGRHLAVIMLDLDHFKGINDRHGHEVGDAVLKSLTAQCRERLRKEDTFARYGGEEFVILVPEADAEKAAALAQRLRSNIAAIRLPTEQGVVTCTCSFGVTQLLQQDENIEAALRRADQALYLAKEQGRDRVVTWRWEDFAPPTLMESGARGRNEAL